MGCSGVKPASHWTSLRLKICRLSGRRGQFVLRADGEEVVFTCGSQAELHGAIRLIQDHTTMGKPPEDIEIVLHKGYLHRGALAVSGFMVFTDRRFSFVPSGLDRLAGRLGAC